MLVKCWSYPEFLNVKEQQIRKCHVHNRANAGAAVPASSPPRVELMCHATSWREGPQEASICA
jgi:hypothetical protein